MEIFTDHSAVKSFLEAQIDALPGPLSILEAGCGRKWPLRVSVPHKLIGIDADANALEIRRRTYNDLHESILGDLRTAQFPEAGFDVIYSSFVLEHVDGAERVLQNFALWLKPNGLLILRVPDRNSVWGVVTRFTPLWLHVLVRRYLMRRIDSGCPGYGPYPVYYDRVISREGIAHFCNTHGLTVQSVIGSGGYLRRSRIIKFVARLIGALSFGRLSWRHNNLTFVIRKS